MGDDRFEETDHVFGAESGFAPEDRTGSLVDLDDDEIVKTLLSPQPGPPKRRWRVPAWRETRLETRIAILLGVSAIFLAPFVIPGLEWLVVFAVVLLFPMGLLAVTVWVTWSVLVPQLRHLAHGVRVEGRVVGNDVGSGSEGEAMYTAVIEYTFEGGRYTTRQGVSRSIPWRVGRRAQVYHIPGSGKSGMPISFLSLVVFPALGVMFILLMVLFTLAFAGKEGATAWHSFVAELAKQWSNLTGN
jgi:hypothetical protein